MGDTSNAMWRFKWTGIVFTDTMLTLPTGCVNEEERVLGVCLGWFSPSKKRSRHRDTDALPAFPAHAPTESKGQHQWLPTLHQGSGRGRRCLPVRTGLSRCFTNTMGEGVLLYAPQRWHIRSFTSGAPGLRILSPHRTWWPSIDTGSAWSLDGACWAPLLAFCLGPCREASGICAVTISLVWITVHHLWC